MKQLFYKVRREGLKRIVPEFIWPKEILFDGVPIPVRHMPYSFGIKYTLVKGGYEGNERILLKERIHQGEVIFEFGGSIGVLTRILAHYAGPEGRVITVEASEQLASGLRKSLENHGNVTVVNGYGFPVGRLTGNIGISGFGGSGSSLGGRVAYTHSNEDPGINEKVFDLDRLMRMSGLRPVVLVIDIEGSETILTEQEPGFPEEVRMILIELHPHIYGGDKMKLVIEAIEREKFALAASMQDVYLFLRAL